MFIYYQFHLQRSQTLASNSKYEFFLLKLISILWATMTIYSVSFTMTEDRFT